MITVIGIFNDLNLAEQASEYLMANEFEPENVDMHTQANAVADTDYVGTFFGHLYADAHEAEHYATLARNGTVITVHANDTREAQEAVDVFNNHGAIEVDLDEPTGNRSLLINMVIDPSRRLRG
ncbi:MAG: hypothetical protein EOP47_06245 [Sphingobacteriaceae bacterium]|nr:MAG: hypothetical protein EOP47_06245 [Sphingobacteriaceae bacterium]